MRHAERLQALGLKVRIELLRRGWYEPRLASELGMSARTLNDRLNAHSDWKLNELLTLSDVLWKGDFQQVLMGMDPNIMQGLDGANSTALLAIAKQIAEQNTALQVKKPKQKRA